MFRHVGNHEYHAYRARRHLLLGLILIIAGSVFLGDRLGIVDAGVVWHFWPVAIGLFGLLKIVSARKLTHVVKGAFYIALAFWLYACIEHLFGWTFRADWPIIVIAFGVSIVLRGMLGKSMPGKSGSANQGEVR
jgi:hypothetical protein